MKFYYFYKITNRINGKFYFGVHGTDNLEDGYMGSGVALKRAYIKYGIENFSKEILAFFSNADEMYSFEEYFVNDSLVADHNCYNMVKGGISREVKHQMSRLAKAVNSSAEVRKRHREGIYRYWSTGDVEAKRKKASDASRKYWETGDVVQKHQHQSDIQKRNYQNHPERREKLLMLLTTRWNGENGESNRRKLGEAIRQSRKHKEAMKIYKESGVGAGYRNFDFLKRWKPVYENKMAEICELLKYSNLPDQFIVNDIFRMKVKVPRLIAYYQSINMLPQQIGIDKRHRFLRWCDADGKGHKDGGSVKTLFSKEIKYNIMPLYFDFFNQFAQILEVEKNNEISDSMVINQTNCHISIPNFKQVIEYFSEMGVVFHIHQITVRVWKTVRGRTFTVPASKTKFTVNYQSLAKILIDKEFNCYGIDDNGMPFQKGQFELEINGEKHPLRCERDGNQNPQLQSSDRQC
ncbi:MAG: GIY-YIG nuclease family protein [Victivallales bacterium]|nr:GIY-YIG nuclease family protein [Victivallales bacterium]